MEAIHEQDGKRTNSGLHRLGRAIAVATLLAISCLVSYWIVTNILSREYSVSRDNELLGGCGPRSPRSLYFVKAMIRAYVRPFHGR
jgi:hypothetical protein